MDDEKAFLIAQCDSLADALEDLLDVTDSDDETTINEPDEDSIGWNGDGPLPMTFGHIRRAKKALAEYRDAPFNPPPGYALVKLEGAEESYQRVPLEERLLERIAALEARCEGYREALEKIYEQFKFNSDPSGLAAGIARAALSKEE